MSNSTITIPLSKRGKYAGQYEAIIDAVDADLAEFSWAVDIKKYGNKYAKQSTKTSKIYLHRIVVERILGRKLTKKEQVDHIDGNGLNNTRDNLRLANPTQNAANSRKQSNNKVGYKGVHRQKKTNKYRARIQVNGKGIHLGYFTTPELAHAAYCEAADKYYGKFANHGGE